MFRQDFQELHKIIYCLGWLLLKCHKPVSILYNIYGIATSRAFMAVLKSLASLIISNTAADILLIKVKKVLLVIFDFVVAINSV